MFFIIAHFTAFGKRDAKKKEKYLIKGDFVQDDYCKMQEYAL